MPSYLSEWKQRTKINQAYSSWKEILFDVPQGSILGPILCKIFLSGLFLIVQNVDFASYDAGVILMRSYFPCKNLLKNFFNGSLIINRKLMKMLNRKLFNQKQCE